MSALAGASEAPITGSETGGEVGRAVLSPPPVASDSFPVGDDSLSRTLVFDHPRIERLAQILVTVWDSGEIDVAMRSAAGATWGPTWSLREVESW